MSGYQLTVQDTVTSLSVVETPVVISEQLTGAQGPKGDAGTNGTNPTVAVGSTTTGAAGTSASVTNSGTSQAAVFNFTIPQGIKGDLGTFTDKGVYSTSTTYSAYDMVTFNGSTYFAKISSTNQRPLQQSNVYWQVMAKGFNGVTGWASGTFYYVGDVVTDGGQTFYCTAQVATLEDRTTNPSDLPSKWLLIAAKGATGATGATGVFGNYYALTSDVVYTSAPTVNVGWSPFTTSSTFSSANLGIEKSYWVDGLFKISGSNTTGHSLGFSMNATGGAGNIDLHIVNASSSNSYTATPASATVYNTNHTALSTYVSLEPAQTTTRYRYIRINGRIQSTGSLANLVVQPLFRYITAVETPTILTGSYLMFTPIQTYSQNPASGFWSI